MQLGLMAAYAASRGISGEPTKHPTADQPTGQDEAISLPRVVKSGEGYACSLSMQFAEQQMKILAVDKQLLSYLRGGLTLKLEE